MDEPLRLSGARFTARYRLSGTAESARLMAADICVEQTVEFPLDLIHRADIKAQIIGEVCSLEAVDRDCHEAEIAYAVETAGRELTQLLNVVFGNSSLKPGIQLVSLTLPEALAGLYRGPRFGVAGLRALVGAPERPLVCTAIKPLGLSSEALAELAYQFATGGVDFIKDDHGLTDQSFGRFADRVHAVCRRVQQANEETGGTCRYLPNVTAPADEVMERARLAKEAGAGGVLVAPGLTGLDTQRRLADDDTIALPVFSHPAFQGAFTVHQDAGITPGVLFGTLNRLGGADAAIFPNFGGRFSFAEAACRDLAERARAPLGQLRALFPVPAGGMSLERVREMRRFYGDDVILLIGGDLHRHGASVAEGARRFVAAVRE